ncbi:MAG TPA: phasin family protein [Telluria sp.]|nr:phasin family protein [Telluria sp.]
MTSFSEQFSAARHSQVEAQLAFMRSLSSKTVESAEKIIALNMSASRASVEKSAAALRQWAGIADPRDLFSLTHQSQDYFDSLLAYGRQLFSIASSMQADLIKPPAPVVAAKAAPAALAAPVAVPAPAPAPAPLAAAATVAAPAAAARAVAKVKPIAKAAKKAVAKPAPFPAAELLDKKK